MAIIQPILSDDVFQVQLHGSNARRLRKPVFTLIDKKDFPIVSKYRWHYRDGYANTYWGPRGKKLMQMHRLLLGLFGRLPFVDHINRNTLDNRRTNLRACTPAENNMNRVPANGRRYKGVFRNSKLPYKFEARIGYQRQHIYLGLFDSQEAAARAYDAKASELYGAFALLNFPSDQNSGQI